MFAFIVGTIAGGLVMWYRDRISQFAADYIIGVRNNETLTSGSAVSDW